MTAGLTDEQRAVLTEEELRALDASSEVPLSGEDIDEPPNSAGDFDLSPKDSGIVNDAPVTQAVISDDVPDNITPAPVAGGDGGA